MRASALKYAILSLATSLAMIIIFVVPLHAFLSIWLAQLFGHYVAIRLWKEALLIICLLGMAYLLLADKKIRSHTLTRRLVWLILAYGLITVVWGLMAYQAHEVTLKALGYGLISNLRFLAFFLVTWTLALRTSRLRANWQRLIIWPALIVVVFGLLQVFVLPHNFLSHFGYGPATIAPYETINQNQSYIRIASTLRGANPLGAYLIIPISLLAVLIMRGKRSWQYIAFFVAALTVLFFSFSRSAWLGAALSITVAIGMSVRSLRAKKLVGAAGLAIIVVAAGAFLLLRHSSHFENVVLHTQANSSIPTTSNEGHVSAFKNGVIDVIHQPLGDGPGTAGPASFYNDHHPRLAENYYVQIAQETGIFGALIFVVINASLGYLLWLRRADPLAACLFVSLVGLSLVNLLSHAWSDDTLAYVWWGLAGIAMVATKPKSDGQH